MNLSFRAMNRTFATEIARWRYEPPYDVYGYADDDVEATIAYLTKKENQFYAVLSEDELVGFRSFGEDGRVSGGNYDESRLDTGGGLRPELTGKGIGPNIIEQGLAFGSLAFGTQRFRVTIADFNLRAKRACEKLGFRPSESFARTSDRAPFTIYTIDLGAQGRVDLHSINHRPK